MKKFLLLIALPLALTACSKDKPDKPKDGQFGAGLHATAVGPVLTVTDEIGTPLAGAKILIGTANNMPFAGNFLVTDANGQVEVSEAWITAEPVTAQAKGFVRLTHMAQEPRSMTLRLRRATVKPALELTGVTNGHPVQDRDGFVDFGLVISAMNRADSLAFDLNRIVSSEMDVISVMGQTVEIPSNITLPRQKESYILPITLEKPAYRMYFSETGVHRVFAARGRFPFKQVIDEVRAKKPFYELINHFTITGGSVKDVNVRTNKTRVDFNVNELKFTDKRAVRAPSLPSGQVFIAAAVADMNGYMVPTDFKRLTSGQRVSLALLPQQTYMMVGLLKNGNEFEGAGTDRLSSVVVPFTDGLQPVPLNLIEDPKVASDGDLLIKRPPAQNGVHELATYGLLSEIREEGKVKTPYRLWEVYAPGFAGVLDLPEWPEGTPLPAKKRWEATYIGSLTHQQAELGAPVVDAATHITHSSVDF